MKQKVYWWMARMLPGQALLYAVVRAFSYFGDEGNHNYKEVWDKVIEQHNLKREDL